MATLEDKILGEKLENYCSSSEGESDGEDTAAVVAANPEEVAPSMPAPVNKGASTNTGPKGVLSDWQRYKQMEIEKRAEDDREKIALMKKLTLTVRTTLDEEKEAAEKKHEDPDSDLEGEDEFILEYQKQRMKELMRATINKNIKFGKLLILGNSSDFLDAIDKEDKTVTVVVHIGKHSLHASYQLDECLRQLSRSYESVKFCTIDVHATGMSRKFTEGGIPALLVYKRGQLVGNFVRVTDELGKEFDVDDVQGFLIENGLIEDRTLKPAIIRNSED